MEHPLFKPDDSLNLEQIQDKIFELNKKLAWAQRSNRDVARQISMAIESLRAQYQDKQKQLNNQGAGKDFSDRIDIS
jgi:hypothetical protein